ncbi:hypothetical protein [Bacteroides congonensis]|uniref:hypothetical protein n=1 Tax=Bacteroides congonensis TaxID=1871006 RepID=UPI0009326987|nr:hypothetical protein [Bacteroides congonensis]
MKQSTYTVQIIQPTEGHILTQASTDIELSDRIFSEKIFLGINDSIDNWKEITIEESEDLKTKQRELIEKEIRK